MNKNKTIKDNLKKLETIAITMGDPAGIGPEIIVSALASPIIHEICNPIVIGDSGIIEMAIKLRNSDLKIYEISDSYHGDFSDISFAHDTINVLNLSNLSPKYIHSKNLSAESGLAMIKYIVKAVDLAMVKKISAIVTAPITKTALKMAGCKFHGHTELIADQTNTNDYSMMLAGERLKVVLVTIHIPLSEVSSRLTVDNIVKTINIAGIALKRNFGIKRPRIAVAGLNPHSGESGMFGNEESSIIAPAIKKAKEILLDIRDGQECKDNGGFDIDEFVIDGPFPPDTIFYHASQGKYDCVICMYHDQGLIPFKLLHFNDGVNTTLGLPIVRTSVDHGTAYDIAWQNKANHTSLVEAVKMAVAQANSLNNQS
ncbi:MAG: 4-hydroxythreonine-4-phosphate dehydrogenase PdxA [Desulfamplus sp.]|nr:4-hydroxythreonine-4-phosphate dehydrogenase PdxA [Desulfamplus sp.]